MKALLCRKMLDPRFLRDFFRGAEHHLVTLADSSAHGTRKLETDRLGQIPIPLPPRAEQQQIIQYISDSTSRIDEVRTANRAYYRLAQGASWRSHYFCGKWPSRSGICKMKVTHLNLANVRVIESAEFHFRPVSTSVVGVNGVGKTTVIEGIGRQPFRNNPTHHTKFRIRTESFGSDAIRIGADSMDIECGFQIDGIQGSYRIHQNREGSVPQMEAGKPREQVIVTPDRAEFVEDFLKIPQMSRQLEAKTEFPSTEAEITPSIRDDGSNSLDSDRGGRPLAIFFSTNRAAPSERKPSRVSAAGGLIAALRAHFRTVNFALVSSPPGYGFNRL